MEGGLESQRVMQCRPAVLIRRIHGSTEVDELLDGVDVAIVSSPLQRRRLQHFGIVEVHLAPSIVQFDHLIGLSVFCCKNVRTHKHTHTPHRLRNCARARFA